MPNLTMLPLSSVLVATATTTTNGTSAALTLPTASSYRFVVQVNTVSGTSPTLQVILATSFDNGTSYNEILSFTNITTTGGGRQMQFRPYLGYGDQITQTFTSTLLGTTDIAAGDVVVNGPIDPRFIKVRWIHSGTSPSFAWSLQACAVPQDLSD